MALWRHNDSTWEKANFAKDCRICSAVLYGSGASLNTADLEEKGSVRFVQNLAFQKVDPHIWVGMDVPSLFGRELFEMPIRKVLRGNYGDELIDGICVKEFDNTYFADLVEMPREAIWTERGMDAKFCWLKNSMVVSLHLILWMGFKEIIFSGIDLCGPYADGREVAPKVVTLMKEEYIFMQWFAKTAQERGIKLINRSPISRLKDLMITETK